MALNRFVIVVRKVFRYFFLKFFPEARNLMGKDTAFGMIHSALNNSKMGQFVNLYPPYHVSDSEVQDYTYVAQNSYISRTTIGKFCSIGPNFLCGWGIHPIDGISTAPMFYSTMRQNGVTLTNATKIEERKPIMIGNDVFIGANVTILDGVIIGDGAVIGAGAVVSKDVPPYAVAVGCPIRFIKYRFSDEQRQKLLNIQWWDFDENRLQDVEKFFFDVDGFISMQTKL